MPFLASGGAIINKSIKNIFRMPFHVELEFASKTDTGLVRSHNEDAIAISEQCGFAILADGMGGYNAGEVASHIATSVLKETLEERLLNKPWESRFHRNRRLHQIITESIVHANSSIIEAARLEPSFTGMGTTLVSAMFYRDKVTIAHIGDSRVYRLRNGGITQLTRDHSLLQEQIDAGILTEQEAELSHNRNLITRALGVDHELEIEISDYVTQANDLYILCSDGLSDMLSNNELIQILNGDTSNLAKACELLIQAANLHGGKDNISVVLTRVLSPSRHPTSIYIKASQWLRKVRSILKKDVITRECRTPFLVQIKKCSKIDKNRQFQDIGDKDSKQYQRKDYLNGYKSLAWQLRK